ncbi:MAG: hypothetical protein AB7K68_07320 [Bacteriovoracia bacterium]
MAKAKKSGKSGSEWQTNLKDFFQTPLADKAGSFLSEKATIALHVEEEAFLFRRKKGENVIEEADSKKCEADVHFWIPASALRHLLDLSGLPGTGLGVMGVAVLEHLFAGEPERKIKFRVDSGFLALWAKGYFSVLKAGGPEVASYVARKGFNSVTRIKEVLKNIRG